MALREIVNLVYTSPSTGKAVSCQNQVSGIFKPVPSRGDILAHSVGIVFCKGERNASSFRVTANGDALQVEMIQERK
jgi:hypothetical protein